MGEEDGSGGRVAERGSDGERREEQRKERIRQMRMSFFVRKKKHAHIVGGRRGSDDEMRLVPPRSPLPLGVGNCTCEQPVVASHSPRILQRLSSAG